MERPPTAALSVVPEAVAPRSAAGGRASQLQALLQARAQSFWQRCCLEELSGALGDLGTLIPLLAACSKMGAVKMGPAIFWMGVFNIVSAVQWDLPMPVQPMKSIAAVAIADGMPHGAFAAAGILTGAIVLLLGITGTIELANSLIPLGVIAGMQVGLGVKMAAGGCNYWHDHQWFDGVDSKITALVCFIFALCMMQRERFPTALAIFALGLVLTSFEMARSGSTVRFEIIRFAATMPTWKEWLDGFVRGTLPQLPLTTLNSVVSVCAVSVQLFGEPSRGGKGASRVSVATSVGLMNLIGCWFGGMPSCHGAGGLAGQYKFGARGGMSVLMLGVAKIVLALAGGPALDHAIQAFPTTILGVLLLFAGVELASVGVRGLVQAGVQDGELLPALVTASAYIGTKNMALGVSAGLLAAAIQRWETLYKTVTRFFTGVNEREDGGLQQDSPTDSETSDRVLSAQVGGGALQATCCAAGGRC